MTSMVLGILALILCPHVSMGQGTKAIDIDNAWRGRNEEASITVSKDRGGMMLGQEAVNRLRRPRMQGGAHGGPRAARYRESVAVDAKVKGARDLKPIALVLPEYHAVPEFEKHCGNLTEWKMLQRTPRTIDSTTTRFPHTDIGYYNFLDLDHRRYMRIMADHFGVYGFCFVHYWYRGRALFQRAMDAMLEDDEPDKPFFVMWQNEPMTNTKDGFGPNVVFPLNYEDDRDNAAHFKYLMKLFAHKNYMTYEDRPILAISHADPQSYGALVGLIESWQELAEEHGVKEIFIVRMLGDYNSDMGAQLFSGIVEMEPGNFQPAGRVKGSLHPGVHLDKLVTWRSIEEKKLRPRWSKDGMRNILGTFWNFNNAPRRINDLGEYSSYPKIHHPDTLNGFTTHLQRLSWRVSTSHYSKVLGYAVFLNSWNIWTDQSMFEPNDVDGYDALAAVKQVFLLPSVSLKPMGVILHSARPEDVTRHVKHLQALFSEYKHTFELLSEAFKGENDNKYVMVHVHHPGLDVTPQNMQACKEKGIPVYISVHDYLWLYPPTDDYPSISLLQGAFPRPGALARTVTAFLLADVVIFPSLFVRSHYMQLQGLREFESDYDRFVVVSPPDVMLNPDKITIPEISRSIGVAMVGEFTPVMGAVVYAELGRTYDHVQSGTHRIDIKYHVLSNRKNCALKQPSSPMTLCALGNDGMELSEIVAGPNSLHMLLFLSEYPDPYSYDLTTAVNTGLPILYLNKGTLRERLSGIRSPRLFPIKDLSELHDQYIEMLKYTVKMSGVDKGFARSENVQPSKWWLSNYPKRTKAV